MIRLGSLVQLACNNVNYVLSSHSSEYLTTADGVLITLEFVVLRTW